MDKLDFIAEVRHIAWVSYQIAAGQKYNEIMNIDQYNSLLDGVAIMIENPKIAPDANHENWMKKKKEQGWVYGKTKDFEKKTHPDLIPFDDLPEIEKRKDIADAISHRLGVELWAKMITPKESIRLKK
jgi:hypothetical protein